MRRCLLASLLLAGCAKVGPPPGGPVDRTPPRVVAHQPAMDATSVPLDARVEIAFSEAMDRQRTEAALFVAPEVEARPRWHGALLTLALDLQPGQTYVVTVGTEARDLRGNALEASFSLAFATGPRLNQGKLVGRVYRDHEPVVGAHVWAYGLAQAPASVGRVPPQYRTQSGRGGEYSFTRLAAGRYRVLAFEDQDRDRKPGEEEALALPAGDLVVSEEDTTRAGDLALVVRRRATPRLQRVLALDRRRVLLEFTQDVSAAQVTAGLEGLPVELVYGVAVNPRRVYLRTAPQEEGRTYPFSDLQVGGQRVPDPPGLRGTDQEDRTPPEVVARHPSSGQMAPDDTLAMAFGEAMSASVPDTFWAASDSTATPAGRWLRPEPARLAFVPATPWRPGKYLLVGRGPLLRDLEGLAPSDTLVTFAFTVPPAQELAGVQGRILPATGNAWVFARRAGQQHRAAADSAGGYTLQRLLPGGYVVWGFVDRDGGGAWDPGVLDPYVPAEPYCRRPGPLELGPGQVATEVGLDCR
ncbi:MAG: Ig-like domain-containing protein [Candidatus Latescibacterota bacterium]